MTKCILLLAVAVAISATFNLRGQAGPPEIGGSLSKSFEPNNAEGSSMAVLAQNTALAHTGQFMAINKNGELTGGNDAAKQVAQVLQNITLALQAGGANLKDTVKVNVYARELEVLPAVKQALAGTFTGPNKPAVSYVISPLPHPDALVAMDAVAVVRTNLAASEAKWSWSPELHGRLVGAHVSVMPAGGRVYVAGQAEKGDLAEAARKTMESLIRTLHHLGLDRKHIAQLKAFVQPMSQVSTVQLEVEKFFEGQISPPAIYVDWITSGNPVEIELVAASPEKKEGEAIEFITPPGMTASPVYSKVARVNRGPIIYVSGLYGAKAVTGEEEVREIFTSLGDILKKAGSDFEHLAKATYYVSGNEASRKLNELRPNYYSPKRPPSASKAFVRGVGAAGKSLTLDMIAIPAEQRKAAE